MKGTPVLLFLAVLSAPLLLASLLSGLRHALGLRDPGHGDSAVERDQMLAAMRGLVSPIDPGTWPEHLRPHRDVPSRDELRRRQDKHGRPAWHDIREDRDARG